MVSIIKRIRIIIIIERNITPCCQIGNMNSRQTATAFENSTANTLHTVANGYGGQAATTLEGIIINGCYAVSDGYGGQATTAKECIKY